MAEPKLSQIASSSLFVTLDGKSIEVATHDLTGATDTILLLHEALGSVAYWKDFPERLARAANANVLVYSRAGQGNSDGPRMSWRHESYLHEIERIIPALLARFGVSRPIVYGHSEGAGLAMMYAAASQEVKLLILESPFVMTLASTSAHIRSLAESYPGSRMQQQLARYHRNADQVFEEWIAAVSASSAGPEAFGRSLGHILCPVLALQGESDEFGTTPHLEAMRAALPQMESEVFAGIGHLPHRQCTDALLERVSKFVAAHGSAAEVQPLAEV